MATDNIDINVRLKADVSDVKNKIKQIKDLSVQEFQNLNPQLNLNTQEAKTQLSDIKSRMIELDEAINVSSNKELGLNTIKFKQELQSSKLSLTQLSSDFSKLGITGQQAFTKLSTAIMTSRTSLVKTTTIFDKMYGMFSRTLGWTAASAAIRGITGSIQGAYGYVKDLDSSLNSIRIVTQKSAEEMDKFAIKANQAAKALGTSTTEYTKASLTFYQQGLNDEEVQARTNLSTKVSNVTGLNNDSASDRVTSVLNGFNIAAEDSEQAMDILANVGAHTASSLDELSEAMAKVSSTAHVMGVSEEQLASSLSTVIQATRLDPSQIGTAFKTIYMRISDIKSGAEDAETTLGNYTSEMANLGINVLNSAGELRDLGEVMEEIGNGWASMSKEQQVALARTMAGTRQANNLLALFDNWDEYNEALGYATNATGTLQQQQDTYMESTAAHIAQLGAAKEDLFDSLFDTSTINSFTDVMKEIIDKVTLFIDTLGGGIPAITAIGGLLTSLFSKQLGSGLGKVVMNMKNTVAQTEEIKIKLAQAHELEVESFTGSMREMDTTAADAIIAREKERIELAKMLDSEQMEQYENLVNQEREALKIQETLRANVAEANAFTKRLEKGTLNTSAVNYGYNNKTGKLDANVIGDANNFTDANNATGIINGSQLEDLQTKTQGVITKQEDLRKDLMDTSVAFETVTSTNQDYTNALNNNTAIQLKTKETKALQLNLTQLVDEEERLKNALTITKQALGEESEEYKQLEIEVNNYSNALNKISPHGKRGTRVKTFKKNPTINPNDYIEVQEAQKKASAAASKNMEYLNSNSKNTYNVNSGLSDDNDGKGNTYKQNEDAIERAKKDVDESSERQLALTQKKTQAITQALSVMAMAGSMVSTIISTLNDDTSSAEDKMKNVLSTVLMMLPMLIPSCISLVESIQSVNAAFVEMGTTAWASLGPYAIIAAAVIATLALLYVAIKKLTEFWNKDAIAAEKAANAAKEAKNAYEAAKNAASELKETISDYQDGLKALKKLTKGTTEYTTALMESNDKARELLDTYNLWNSKYYTFDAETGALTLKPEAYDEINQQTQEQLYNASKNLSIANIDKIKTQQASDLTDMSRSDKWSSLSKVYGTETIKKAISEAHVTTGEDLKTYLKRAKKQYDSSDYIDDGIALGIDVLSAGLPGIATAINKQLENMALSDVANFDDSTWQNLANAVNKEQEAIEQNTQELIRNTQALYSDEIEQKYADYLDQNSRDENGNIDAVKREALKNALINDITDINGNAKEKADELGTAYVSDLFTKETKGFGGALKQSSFDKDTLKETIKQLGTERGEELVSSGVLDKLSEGFQDLSKNDAIALAISKGLLSENVDASTLSWDKKALSDKNRNLLVDISEINRQELITQMMSSLFLDSFLNKDTKNQEKTISEKSSKFNEIETAVKDYGGSVMSHEIETAYSSGVKFNLNNILSDLDPETLSKLSGLSQERLIKALGLDADTLAKMGGDTAESFYASFQESLSSYDASEYWKKQASQAEIYASGTSAAIKKAQGETLTDEEQTAYDTWYEKYKERLKNLKEGSTEYYSELRKIRQEEESSGITALQNEKDAIDKKIQDIQAEISITTNKESLNKLYGELDVLQDNLDALTKNINIEIYANVKTDASDLMDMAKELDNLTGTIKDDLEYTTSEIQTLIDDGYGEMLENASYTADGMVKLDQSVVNAYIDGKQEEIKADAEAKITQLENENKIIDAERETLKKEKESLEAGLKATTSTEKAKYLATASMYHAEYQAQQNKLNAITKAEAEAVETLDDNQKKLYNSLGGMYEDDLANQQAADKASLDSTNENITKTINAYEKAYNAVQTFASQVKVAGDGTVLGKWNVDNVLESYTGGSSNTSNDIVSTLGTVKSEIENNINDLISANKWTTDEVDEIINATLASVDSQLNELDELYGVNQGTIAALKASYTKTDYTQTNSENASENNKSVEDFLEMEADRYYEVSKAIEYLTNVLEDLQKVEERLVGQDLINNLNEQLKVIEKQNKAYSEKINLAKGEAAELRGTLNNFGARFDENGYISNYNEAKQNAVNKANQGIAWYNSLDKDSQDLQSNKDALNYYKGLLNDFEDAANQYNTVLTDYLEESLDLIEENLSKEIEIKVKEMKVEIELQLNKNEFDRTFQDFYKDVVLDLKDDDYLGQYKADTQKLETYINNDTGEIATNLKALQLAEANLKKAQRMDLSSAYLAMNSETGTIVGDGAQAKEDIETYAKDLMTAYQDAKELIETMKKYYDSLIDKLSTKYSDLGGAYDSINKQLNHQIKLIELTYGDKAYGRMQNYYNQQMDNNKKYINALQEESKVWYDKMNNALAEGDTEHYELFYKKYQETIDSLYNYTEQQIELMSKSCSNTIKASFNDIMSSYTKDMDLDSLKKELDLLNPKDNMFLDSINMDYAIQDLKNKWVDAINDTDSLTTQQMLTDEMNKQISALEEQGQLTQYQVDRAEKEYEIAIKKAQLADAQQNKSKMRLRRDENGNYSYQFTADDNEINKLQSELSKLQNDLYNFDKDAFQNVKSQWIEAYSSYINEMAEINANVDYNEEERRKLSEEAYARFLDKKTGIQQNAANIEKNLINDVYTFLESKSETQLNSLSSKYGIELNDFQNKTDEELKAITEKLVPGWNDGVDEMIDKIAGDEGFDQIIKESTENFIEEGNSMQDKTKALADEMNAYGETSKEVAEEYIYYTDECIDETMYEIEVLEEELDMLQEVETQLQSQAESISQVISQISSLDTSIQNVKGSYGQLATQIQDCIDKAYELANANGGNGIGGGGGSIDNDNDDKNNNNDDKKTVNKTSPTFNGDKTTSRSANQGYRSTLGDVELKNTNSKTPSEARKKAQSIWDNLISLWANTKSESVIRGALSSYQAASSEYLVDQIKLYYKGQVGTPSFGYKYYKTGGLADFTGPAWLDGTKTQPELVLNASDTQNLLSAIDILDNITSSLNNGVLNNLVSALNNATSITGGVSGGSIDQNVTINAKFEGQTEARQIQTALDNLVNLAAQRAHRNIK